MKKLDKIEEVIAEEWNKPYPEGTPDFISQALTDKFYILDKEGVGDKLAKALITLPSGSRIEEVVKILIQLLGGERE